MATESLDHFYEHVQHAGKLRTRQHAERYARAVLQTLGLALSRGTKRKLANELPQTLANQLSGVFWLLHFRDESMSAIYFQDRVARRSGNTDKSFARFPVLAVFGALKHIASDSVSQAVADDLPPEIAEMWREAKLPAQRQAERA